MRTHDDGDDNEDGDDGGNENEKRISQTRGRHIRKLQPVILRGLHEGFESASGALT